MARPARTEQGTAMRAATDTKTSFVSRQVNNTHKHRGIQGQRGRREIRLQLLLQVLGHAIRISRINPAQYGSIPCSLTQSNTFLSIPVFFSRVSEANMYNICNNLIVIPNLSAAANVLHSNMDRNIAPCSQREGHSRV